MRGIRGASVAEEGAGAMAARAADGEAVPDWAVPKDAEGVKSAVEVMEGD